LSERDFFILQGDPPLVRVAVQNCMPNALASFEGVRRRQELLGTPGGVSVYDDFARHRVLPLGRNNLAPEVALALDQLAADLVHIGKYAERCTRDSAAPRTTIAELSRAPAHEDADEDTRDGPRQPTRGAESDPLAAWLESPRRSRVN
jgi:hypothetical protein